MSKNPCKSEIQLLVIGFLVFFEINQKFSYLDLSTIEILRIGNDYCLAKHSKNGGKTAYFY
jgi:hypothetical protein